MNTEALQAMDEQADKVISKWSFAALGVNLLPPPFDMIAVGGVFAGMGKRLASIYGMQMNQTVLRDLGKAIASGIGTVLAGYYVGTGLLKFIPGVNIWVALLVQPPVVGAVAYAAGHTFKQYYHVIITEGRYLTPKEAGELVKKVLHEKLSALRESGYRFQSQESLQPGPKPKIETLPYAERQLIVLVHKSLKKNYISGQLLELGANLSRIRFVSHDEVKNLSFPVGHPRGSIIYVGHPLIPTKYYPAAEFHRRLFEHKVAEVSRMLRYLGAEYIRIERTEGYTSDKSLDVTIEALGQDIKGEASYNRKSSSSVMFEANYRITDPPRRPEDMVWYDREDLWKEIAEGRLKHGAKDFRLDIVYKDDFGINANLSRSVEKLKIKLDLGGKFSEYQQTIWHISGTFGEPERS